MTRLSRWIGERIGGNVPTPAVHVPSDLPCGELLDRFVSDPALRVVGVVDPKGRLVGIVDRRHFFSLVEVVGDGVFGRMPAERLLRS